MGVQVVTPSIRFHALDWARVVAMFLGVFYHLPIAFMAGGFGMDFSFGGSPKTPIDNWLHSFRMPLFFLISGFFAQMMLGKYGAARYLARRWWRIGAPLIIALFAFAGLRMASSYFQSSSPLAFAPPATPNAAGPAGQPGGFGTPNSPFPFGGPVAGPGPFGPMPGGGMPTGAGLPGPAPFGGPVPGFNAPAPPSGVGEGGAAFGPPPFPVPGGAFGGPGPSAAVGPSAPAFALPPAPTRALADRLFGKYSQHFNLEHLWFLWYLLVFVTIAPLVHVTLQRLVPLPPGTCDRLGQGLTRFHLLALVLGLVTVPALIHARGFAGWSLANPIGFLASFPDFVFQYHADEPYYFLYFLAGWWLYRAQSVLSHVARTWLWNLVLGIAGFAVSQALSDTYALRPNTPYYEWYRLGGFTLYSLGAAYSACAFLGFFQRYLDRPTRLGRYFADTILWVYLVHLPLIPYVLWWIQPGRSAWWVDTLAGMVLVTGIALVLFELCVRHTPLVHIFGPPTPRRREAEHGPLQGSDPLTTMGKCDSCNTIQRAQ
jgi:surface polysaccharide O-acyltransferase-like enzyme